MGQTKLDLHEVISEKYRIHIHESGCDYDWGRGRGGGYQLLVVITIKYLHAFAW